MPFPRQDFGISFLDALTATLIPSLTQSLQEGIARKRQQGALADLAAAGQPNVSYQPTPSAPPTLAASSAYAGAQQAANQAAGPTLAGGQLTPGPVQAIPQLATQPQAQGVQRVETPVNPNDPAFMSAYLNLASMNPGLADSYMRMRQMGQPIVSQEGSPTSGIYELTKDPTTNKVIGQPREIMKPQSKSIKVQYVDAEGNQRVAEFTPEQLAANGGVATLPGGTLAAKKETRAAAQATEGVLDPETLDYYARILAADPMNPQAMPRMGIGKAAQKTRIALLNASVKYTGNDPGGAFLRHQALSANQAALTQTTKSKAAVSTFEKTGRRNLQNFLESAKNVVDTGSPWINTPLREVDANALGSPEVAAYNTARRVAINEIAKVLSNPNLTGALSDAARQEVESFNPGGATLAQTYAVADILNRDMENRIQAIEETEQGLKGQIRDLTKVGIPGAKKVVRTGTLNGRKVVQYEDGTTEYQK